MWRDPVIVPLIGIAILLTIISIFSAIILLDARENAYCVPLERAASLVAGVAGALLLAWGWGLPSPTGPELVGAAILIAAIVLLSIAPRIGAAARLARAEAQ